MKIITIMGSPRKKGNTAAVLALFEKQVSAKHQVERINITDHKINGCLGCDGCQPSLDAPGCKQKDDAVAILNRLIAADVVVYATPVYCWSFSAQMKALIDRHYCLVKWCKGEVASMLFKDKPVALLATCGGSAEYNADLLQAMFDRNMDYLGSKVIGKYVVPDCTTPAELGEKADKIASAMAKDIVGN
ncbi:MAG: NAD(P)H-dependent oxidoreductase [Anaerolineaceae bacterium]|nr:NAD(P)H-dependent oxidoreductase [Anaerolineaceae bacterium]